MVIIVTNVLLHILDYYVEEASNLTYNTYENILMVKKWRKIG